MNQDTINLLQQCNAGCKNATNSMEQVTPFIKDESFHQLIADYDRKHIALGDECHKLLAQCGEEEKDPSTVTKAFSWLGTEMKMLADDSTKKIAELMMDGCHMGIKSVGGYCNQYRSATPESMRLARHLIETEQTFQKDLLTYL